ncbi:hypothetical protein HU200_026928 [Digitaria exilis]|uniref:Peptidase A1 domain-containing protein n=1 Tax=Digitaria exilis TaxID=1010633 RepID=A0A835C8S5_9POAL|nr:hypothetical protein HU200_026928 [Digitaria exilis]
METKLTAGLALITALLTHHLSLAIANHTRASNASSADMKVPGYSTRRGSDSFLYLKHNRNASEGPIYNPIGDGSPMRSPIYRPITGSDKICMPEHGMEPAGAHYAFHVAGPGGLSVHGYIAREHVVDLETNKISPNFVLGCSHSTENFQSEGEYAGIATLSQAPTSLAMQLAARFLRFGADVPHNPRLGARRLDMIHPEMFSQEKGGQSGTVIDLGTSVTVMAEEAYRVIEEAMWSQLKEHGAERRSNAYSISRAVVLDD